MTGLICPLKQLCDIAHAYGALTFVDEVHAVGLYGTHGAGIGEQFNELQNMDVISGTLGKAFGVVGGYIASTSALVDMVRSYAPGFIFSTSLPPMVMSAALKSIEVLSSPEGVKLRAEHKENVNYLREKLFNTGFPVESNNSHILPVHVGDPFKCTTLSNRLLKEKDHYVQSINFPTVPRGREKLRLAPTPYHCKQSIDSLVTDLVTVWKDVGLQLDYNRSHMCEVCHRTKCEVRTNHADVNLPLFRDVRNCPMCARKL